jgi:HEAT repeat protein
MEHAAQIAEIGESMKGSSTFDPMVAAVEKLALAAGDPPAQDIIAVAETLLLPAVSSRIVALLGVEKDETRQAELRTVCIRIGHPMAVALSDALAETKDRFARHACVGTIVEMGQAAMPVVEAMIEDKRWFVVRNAVTVLGDSGGPRAIELIMSTLANSDGRVRREALQALAKLGGEDAGQLVYGMLEDPDSEVRIAAAVACGELKVERALKLLVKMLEDEKKNPDFIVAVLRALGQLGDPGAVNAIEKHATPSLFSRPRTDVRIAAYRALNHIGTPYARRLLNRAADDKDQEVKRIVRDILGMG